MKLVMPTKRDLDELKDPGVSEPPRINSFGKEIIPI
jgi:hypothetical protein